MHICSLSAISAHSEYIYASVFYTYQYLSASPILILYSHTCVHLSKSMQVCKYAHSFSSSAPCNSCKCKKCIQHLMWMYLLRNRPIKIFTAGISLNSVLIYFKGFFKRREIEMSDNLEIMLLYHYLCLFLITHKYCQLLCHQGPNFCPVSQQ